MIGCRISNIFISYVIYDVVWCVVVYFAVCQFIIDLADATFAWYYEEKLYWSNVLFMGGVAYCDDLQSFYGICF